MNAYRRFLGICYDTGFFIAQRDGGAVTGLRLARVTTRYETSASWICLSVIDIICLWLRILHNIIWGDSFTSIKLIMHCSSSLAMLCPISRESLAALPLYL